MPVGHAPLSGLPPPQGDQVIRRVVTGVLFALGVLVLAGGIGIRLLDLRMQTV